MRLARVVNWELDARRRATLVTGAVAVTALIGVAHFASGPEYDFHIFYLLPVMVTSWFVGLRAGAGISFLSALNWLIMDSLTLRGDMFVVMFNQTARLGVLLLVSYLATRLRSVLRRESYYARVDPLTGAANRRLFFEEGARELSRARRDRGPLTVMFIDLDNFKAVNDTLGHAEGDTLLTEVAETLRHATRASDTVGRLGGDEFAVLMPDMGREKALAGAAKLQQRLLSRMTEHEWPVTFSIGVVTYVVPPLDVEALISRADALMYQVKREGKNTIRHQVVAA